uniref:Uncharacterized protein n=1 Tax=Mycena chlorophos TaxID=658473 RepID=A0ABQ0LMH5_MYCCL|nr:predicted protein [Mycena chlorophos]
MSSNHLSANVDDVPLGRSTLACVHPRSSAPLPPREPPYADKPRIHALSPARNPARSGNVLVLQCRRRRNRATWRRSAPSRESWPRARRVGLLDRIRVEHPRVLRTTTSCADLEGLPEVDATPMPLVCRGHAAWALSTRSEVDECNRRTVVLPYTRDQETTPTPRYMRKATTTVRRNANADGGTQGRRNRTRDGQRFQRTAHQCPEYKRRVSLATDCVVLLHTIPLDGPRNRPPAYRLYGPTHLLSLIHIYAETRCGRSLPTTSRALSPSRIYAPALIYRISLRQTLRLFINAASYIVDTFPSTIVPDRASFVILYARVKSAEP